MNREIPFTFKNIFALIFMILITFGFHYLLIAPEDEAAEGTVLLKNSKKGLYLYPRYEVLVLESDKPTMITKETFDAINIGDKIDGYVRGADSFVTKDHVRIERWIMFPIAIFLYLGLLFYIIAMLNSTKFIKKRKKSREKSHHLFHSIVTAILIMYFSAGFIFISLIGVNLFHKLNYFNLIETKATIQAGDWERTRSHRGGSYTTYELLLSYSDESGESHLTRKAVTRNTYKLYDLHDEVSIFYRKNNVDDTFIKAGSFNEVWETFVNMFIFFIGLYLYSIYYLIRHWRKKLKKKKDEHHGNEAAQTL